MVKPPPPPQKMPPSPDKKGTATAAAAPPAGTGKKPETAKKAPPPAAAKAKVKTKADPAQLELSEEELVRRHTRQLKLLTMEAILIGVATTFLVIAMPMFQTRYYYYSVTPEHNITPMTALSMPNLTNATIKTWASVSATEILTFGFGDYNAKLLKQKERFTSSGWSDFVHAFLDNKVGDSVRKSQLVLTTIPADDPTILSQGVNERGIYQWMVRVPVITTYATNNQVAKPGRATVTLTIIRVSYDENDHGVAIDGWSQ